MNFIRPMSRRRAVSSKAVASLSRASHKALVEALESRTLFTALTIAQENALPGTPQSVWDVSGNGDTNLQGYATNNSVNVGATETFKVDDTGVTPYHLNIYRLGYYQGYGARLVTTIPSSQTQAVEQPSPTQDPTTGMIDASNWSVTASWAVPADATSGVYLADIVRDSNGGTSQMLFVVRNDASHSAALVTTSDATSQAYNSWGGASLYVGDGPGAAPAAGRSFAVSYERPMNDRGVSGGLGDTNSFFYEEFPMVRFLEANGYDVSYQTDVDTARGGAAVLEQHKVFMTVGHDEYWSGKEFTAVQQARDAGVNIDFFSGNTAYWKTRYGTNADGSTNYSVMICYKESLAVGKTDPSSIWTGEWQDPGFLPKTDAVVPQNALTGDVFISNRGPNDTGTPMTVPSTMSQFRLWRNTSVAALTPGQVATLGTYVLGYEWDVNVDNGFRPAGEVDLSSTTQTVSQAILDPAEDLAADTQTHSLTLYRAASGALVFNAATVQWDWALDATHDGPAAPTDPDLRQATVNLFADEGLQPTTAQAGLVLTTASGDHTPPTSTLTAPSGNTVVEQNGFATVSGTAADAGGGVVAGVEVSVDGGQTWHYATGLNAWTYTWAPASPGAVTVLTRATDDSANTETPKPGVTLTVAAGDGSLSLFSTTQLPAVQSDGDSSSVEVGVKFRTDVAGYITGIRFFKGTANTGVHTGELWSSSGALLSTATFTNESTTGWQAVTFATPVAVAANTTYVASYHTSAGHYADNVGYFTTGAFTQTGGVDHGTLHAPADGVSEPNGVYAYSSSVAFPNQTSNATNYWVDVVFSPSAQNVTPPVVVAQSPVPGATNVATASSLSVTFDQAIQLSTLGFALTDANNNPVAATLSYSAASDTATLTPAAPLAVSTTYHVTVSGAKDSAGVAMTAPVAWSFTTAASTAPVSLSVWSDSTIPAVTADPDNSSVELGVKFRSDTAGFISGIRFYKGATNTGVHVGNLWSSTGQLLATVTFGNETASGWQTATFSQPVAIQANTTYVASYHTTVGHYADTSAYFATAGADNGTLHALANGVDGADGLFLYGSGGFPTQSYNATNYWVDVVYTSAAAVTPAVTSVTPAAGASGVGVASPVTLTFNEALNSTTVTSATIQLLDPTNTPVAATLSYNPATFTVTLTPTAPLANSTAYTVSVVGGGVKDNSGVAIAGTFTSSFTTVPVAGAAIDLFPSNPTPTTVTTVDPNSVELGVKFRTDVAGTITGVRFYKGPYNTGTHTGSLWSSTGQLLATATFTGETASGWQTVTFSTPVAVQPNTTYVASYHAPVGAYSADGGYFASAGVTDGPLHGSATGVDGSNGVYLYGTGGFPTQSYNSTNYWVDVVFVPGAAVVAPAVTGETPPAGSVNVGVHTAPTATFSTAMNAATLTPGTVRLLGPGNAVVTASVAYNATTFTATLTPTSALAAGTTYTVDVVGGAAGVKDASGNALAADVTWTFTTNAPWTQSAASGFGSGTPGAGVSVGSGGVQLASPFDDEFDGTTLSAAWKAASLGSGSGVAVASGVVKLRNESLTSVSAFANPVVDVRLQLTSSPAQQFGIAAGNNSAEFVTVSGSATLYAVVTVNQSSHYASLGAAPSGYHVYRVKPTTTGVTFLIDGATVATVPTALPSAAYNVVLSTNATTAPKALAADYVRVGYPAAGTFVSSVFDATRQAAWGTATWSATLPQGTGLTVLTRSGNTATPDATWSAWAAVSNGGTVASPAGRYLQYELLLTTTDPGQTPVVASVSFQWS